MKLKTLKDLESDDLAFAYKEYEKLGTGISTMEICYRESANQFVIRKIKQKLKQEAIKWVKEMSHEDDITPWMEFFNITEEDIK